MKELLTEQSSDDIPVSDDVEPGECESGHTFWLQRVEGLSECLQH